MNRSVAESVLVENKAVDRLPGEMGAPLAVPRTVNSIRTPSEVAPRAVDLGGHVWDQLEEVSEGALACLVVEIIGAERRAFGASTVSRRSATGACQNSVKRLTKSATRSWSIPGTIPPRSALAPLPEAGLFKDVWHDPTMHRLDSGPHCACDCVLLLHEGAEEQCVPLALEEQLGWQPQAGAGSE